VTCGGRGIVRLDPAVVRAGDEAIIFDPSYDAYEPAVRLAGAAACGCADSADVRFDWDRIRGAVRIARASSSSTPAEPELHRGGLGRPGCPRLARARRRISILADEVYEHVSTMAGTRVGPCPP